MLHKKIWQTSKVAIELVFRFLAAEDPSHVINDWGPTIRMCVCIYISMNKLILYFKGEKHSYLRWSGWWVPLWSSNGRVSAEQTTADAFSSKLEAEAEIEPILQFSKTFRHFSFYFVTIWGLKCHLGEMHRMQWTLCSTRDNKLRLDFSKCENTWEAAAYCSMWVGKLCVH